MSAEKRNEEDFLRVTHNVMRGKVGFGFGFEERSKQSVRS